MERENLANDAQYTFRAKRPSQLITHKICQDQDIDKTEASQEQAELQRLIESFVQEQLEELGDELETIN